MMRPWQFVLVIGGALLVASCGGSSADPQCGDGHTDVGEQCDDGNTSAGDGCSATCQNEPTPACGDGHTDSGEACDDGNTVPGDGCDATCQTELPCGNGRLDDGEACDDKNAKAEDGCSPACAVEPGYDCHGAPSLCASVCGDSRVAAGIEQCDDGNGSNGDGCTNGCAAEPGYQCTGSPSSCVVVCGDGAIAPAFEKCDDGNMLEGDGCSALCALEVGYACTGEPSTCSTVCGDGLRAGGTEECDDGNTADGDCCSATCTFVAGCETELNNDQPTADPVDGHFVSDVVKGNVFPSGDADYYLLTLPAGNEYDVTVQTLDGYTGRTCASGTLDSEVDVFDTAAVNLAHNDNDGSNKCARARLVVPGGATYYLKIKSHNTSTFDYTLKVLADAIVCGDGIVGGSETCDDANAIDGDGCSKACVLEGFNEVENNDASTSANGPIETGKIVIGKIDPAADQDFFKFVLTASSDVELETFDKYGPPSCDPSVNTVLQLRGPNGTTVLVEDDEDGVNSCSKITATTDAAARALPAGTYYARVIDQGQNSVIPGYTLKLSLLAVCGDAVVAGSEECDSTSDCDAACQRIPLCGDGFVDGPEQCDGGNSDPGDGCDAQCKLEHVCGNGALEVTELCDDGNTANGDGCDSACAWEVVNEIEPNDSAVDAVENGLFGVKGLLGGTIATSGDKDYFRFTVPAQADVEIETYDATGPANCATGINTRLKLFAPNGTTELANDDEDGVNSCSKITPGSDSGARKLAPGKYFIEVEHGSNNGVVAGYRVAVRMIVCGDGKVGGSEECDGTPGCDATCQRIPVCGDGFLDTPEQCDDSNLVDGDGCESTCTYKLFTELEPNNNTASAQSVAAGGVVSAAITPVGDNDFFAVTLTKTSSLYIETYDSGAGLNACNGGIDTVIRLFRADGSQIMEDDEDGINSCSKIDPTVDSAAKDLAPGTYYVSVEDWQNNGTIGAYQVLIRVQ